ncbi:MAG: hypothetical protein HN509_03360 [Halobacteriovoraceae bacterium]|nr:hypothetical protein [Halobacteriovoraceae bacterium]MBT5095853.1 hypothetical protein [Halobacteriovoraceae bacterium]
MIQQFNKYKKVYDELERERQNRLELKPETELLYTKNELATRKKEAVKSEPVKKVEEVAEKKEDATGEVEADNSANYQLHIDTDELSQLEADREAKKKEADQEEDDEVRVTQLLKLSKEQLEELRKDKK